MGQKSSKKPDLYVTEDVTHCSLPENEVTEFVGRAREYTAVNVSVEDRPVNSMYKFFTLLFVFCLFVLS